MVSLVRRVTASWSAPRRLDRGCGIMALGLCGRRRCLLLAAAAIIARHDVASADTAGRGTTTATGHVDYAGAILVTLGLAGTIGALIDGPHRGFGSPGVLAAGVGGVILLAAFVVLENRVARRGAQPLLPLAVFRSRQFTGANIVTVLVYAALNALLFLLMPQLQANLGYSALAAGAALLPANVLMLALSPAAGRLSARIGPRLPMRQAAPS